MKTGLENLQLPVLFTALDVVEMAHKVVGTFRSMCFIGLLSVHLL